MPVPTNLTPATALLIPSLPYSVTLDAFEVPNESLWFRYDKVAGGYTALGYVAPVPIDTGTYVPTIHVYTGTPDDLEGYLDLDAVNIPITVPFGQAAPIISYFFEVHRTSLPSTFTEQLLFELIPGPVAAAPPGSIAINDDTNDDFPMAIVDPVTGLVSQSFPFPAGETAAMLPTGYMLWAARWQKKVFLYSPLFVQVAEVVWSPLSDHDDSPVAPMTASLTTFYVGDIGRFTGTARNAMVAAVDADGVVTATYDLGSYFVWSLAVSPDDTILYYTQASGNTPIKRWDLVNDVALSNLAAGVASTIIPHEMLVMADGSVIQGFRWSGGADYVLRYSAAGAVLNTYPVPGTDSFNRLAHGGDGTTFWVWRYLTTPSGYSGFQRIRASDGVVLESVEGPQSIGGIYQGPNPGEPATGHSFSCPFIIVPPPGLPPITFGPPIPPEPPEPPGGVTYETVTRDQRRLRRAAHLSAEHRWLTYDTFQLDLQAGVGLTTGQGDDPQVMVRWSNDGGHTWSNEHWRTAGRQGARKTRVIVRQTGRARLRTFEVVVSDPVAWFLAAAYLEVTPGDGT